MTAIRSLVLALALATTAPLAGLPLSAAQAAEADEAPGLTAILPVPWAVADGESKVRVQVVVLTESGKPMGGVELKPEASEGEASGWTEVGPGLYRFTYTPPKSDKATDVTLTVKGKAGKDSVEASTTVRLARNALADLSGTVSPERVVLGKDDKATLSFTGGPPKGDLLVRHTTSGEIENLTNMGGGKFTAGFKAPKENFPQLAIVTLASAADPIEDFGYMVAPLNGAVNYPVKGPDGASVLLRIDGKEFGPVKIADGKAAIPVVVPPGVQEATQITVVDGDSEEQKLDLKVPDTLRVKAVPTARAVPASSDIELPIRVVVLKPDGSPDKKAELTGRATGGKLSGFKHTTRGIYEATFTPADSDTPGSASITVGIDGDDKQTDTLEFELMPRRATELVVTTDPSEIGADTKTIAVTAVATGANMQPVPGQILGVDVVGGRTSSAVSDKGDGAYEVTVEREADVVKLGLVVTGAPSNNPAAHLIVLPARDRFDGDGAAAADVVVVAVDRFGYPVSGVDVELSVDGGGASLPTKVRTNDQGFGRVELTSGKGDALVTITAQAGPARGAGAILQGGKRKALKGMPITISADKEGRQLHKAWENAAVNVRLAIDPNAPPPVPVYEIASADAEAASLEVSFFPRAVAPGGAVTVRAVPLDADGKAIPGKTLDVLTSSGDLGDTKESKGIYETVLTIDKDAEKGEAKVSVVAPSGVMKLVKVPIDPDAVMVVADADDERGGGYADSADEDSEDQTDGTADATSEPEEPAKPEKPPKEPKAPSEAGDHPWLRARVSGVGSVYRYAQTPTDDPGPLIPAPLTVGGEGSTPATPIGFEFAGRAWMPDLPYVGVVGNFRTQWYAISSGAFSNDAPDWLYDVNLQAAGRYPFDVGADQYWVGGKAGFHYDDFMIFTGCLDAGCQVNFDPLPMAGLGLGAEVGAEIDAANLYFIAGYNHALARFSVPYMNGVDANVGMAVVENVNVDAGFSWINRKIGLDGNESGERRGELSDSQIVFKLGVGFEM